MRKIIVALGNPGNQYAATRHNVGFDVADQIAKGFEFRSNFDGLFATLEIRSYRIMILKPQTYMNESGRSVSKILKFFKLSPDKILVVCDDMSLPLGHLRFRRSGSDGGQKGLRSIAQHLGTNDFNRLRIGIGDRGKQSAAKFVLDKFSNSERPIIDEAIQTSSIACITWAVDGIDKAMNKFNTQKVS